MKHVFRVVVAVLLAAVVGSPAPAAILTPISSPAGFVSPTTFTNDFETDINTPQFTFDATAELDLASALSGGVTSSGVQGLKEFPANGPLQVTFTTPIHEIGMFFGNDDFGFQFDAVLDIFDSANVSLGSIQVPVNQNDFVDQYLGIRSDTPIKSAVISYQRPQAAQLAVFIDDFKIGIVPEPTGVLLVLAGILSVAAGVRARRRG